MNRANVFGALATVVALVLGYARYNISRIPRVSMAEQTSIKLSVSDDPTQLKVFKILKRGSSSEIESITGPKAAGFYPNWPGSPPMHRHTDEDEEFTVLSGTLGYILDGEEATSTKSGVLPMGKSHTIWNADPSQNLHCRFKMVNRSGKRREGDRFFENLAAFARLYGGIGSINPLQHFLTANEGGVEYTFVPVSVRVLIRYIICPLAKIVGYQAYYPEYRSATP